MKQQPRTDVGPGLNGFYRRKTNDAHAYGDDTKRESRDKAPDLALVELQFFQERERQHKNCYNDR